MRCLLLLAIIAFAAAFDNDGTCQEACKTCAGAPDTCECETGVFTCHKMMPEPATGGKDHDHDHDHDVPPIMDGAPPIMDGPVKPGDKDKPKPDGPGTKPKPDFIPKMCCKALTLPCMACAAGLDVKEYCRQNPGKPGCKKVPVDPIDTKCEKQCVKGGSFRCAVCKSGMDTAAFCEDPKLDRRWGRMCKLNKCNGDETCLLEKQKEEWTTVDPDMPEDDIWGDDEILNMTDACLNDVEEGSMSDEDVIEEMDKCFGSTFVTMPEDEDGNIDLAEVTDVIDKSMDHAIDQVWDKIKACKERAKQGADRQDNKRLMAALKACDHDVSIKEIYIRKGGGDEDDFDRKREEKEDAELAGDLKGCILGKVGMAVKRRTAAFECKEDVIKDHKDEWSPKDIWYKTKEAAKEMAADVLAGCYEDAKELEFDTSSSTVEETLEVLKDNCFEIAEEGLEDNFGFDPIDAVEALREAASKASAEAKRKCLTGAKQAFKAGKVGKKDGPDAMDRCMDVAKETFMLYGGHKEDFAVAEREGEKRFAADAQMRCMERNSETRRRLAKTPSKKRKSFVPPKKIAKDCFEEGLSKFLNLTTFEEDDDPILPDSDYYDDQVIDYMETIVDGARDELLDRTAACIESNTTMDDEDMAETQEEAEDAEFPLWSADPTLWDNCKADLLETFADTVGEDTDELDLDVSLDKACQDGAARAFAACTRDKADLKKQNKQGPKADCKKRMMIKLKPCAPEIVDTDSTGNDTHIVNDINIDIWKGKGLNRAMVDVYHSCMIAHKGVHSKRDAAMLCNEEQAEYAEGIEGPATEVEMQAKAQKGAQDKLADKITACTAAFAKLKHWDKATELKQKCIKDAQRVYDDLFPKELVEVDFEDEVERGAAKKAGHVKKACKKLKLTFTECKNKTKEVFESAGGDPLDVSYQMSSAMIDEAVDFFDGCKKASKLSEGDCKKSAKDFWKRSFDNPEDPVFWDDDMFENKKSLVGKPTKRTKENNLHVKMNIFLKDGTDVIMPKLCKDALPTEKLKGALVSILNKANKHSVKAATIKCAVRPDNKKVFVVFDEDVIDKDVDSALDDVRASVSEVEKKFEAVLESSRVLRRALSESGDDDDSSSVDASQTEKDVVAEETTAAPSTPPPTEARTEAPSKPASAPSAPTTNPPTLPSGTTQNAPSVLLALALASGLVFIQ